MARGPKKHMKRLNAPKHWMLDKLGGTWVSHQPKREERRGWYAIIQFNRYHRSHNCSITHKCFRIVSLCLDGDYFIHRTILIGLNHLHRSNECEWRNWIILHHIATTSDSSRHLRTNLHWLLAIIFHSTCDNYWIISLDPFKSYSCEYPSHHIDSIPHCNRW